MEYFIRQDATSDVMGPYSVSELLDKIETGLIHQDWLASSNMGDSLESLQKFRSCDWFHISKISELHPCDSIPQGTSSTLGVSTPPIKCLRCESEMEEGFSTDSTVGGILVPTWIAGLPERSFWSGTRIQGKDRFPITSYRCPQCGYLESYARETDG